MALHVSTHLFTASCQSLPFGNCPFHELTPFPLRSFSGRGRPDRAGARPSCNGEPRPLCRASPGRAVGTRSCAIRRCTSRSHFRFWPPDPCAGAGNASNAGSLFIFAEGRTSFPYLIYVYLQTNFASRFCNNALSTDLWHRFSSSQ